MGGHVTYACNCLNVKIHLANKYYLEGHEKFRRDKFTRLEEPPIEGWKFELSMDGVTVVGGFQRETRSSNLNNGARRNMQA